MGKIKIILGLTLGLGLVSTFVIVANANDSVEIKEQKSEVISKDEKEIDVRNIDLIKPNNFDFGERVDVVLNILGVSSDEKNTTTEKDLLNYTMVILKVLYDNKLLSEEIIDEMFDDFRHMTKLKLFSEMGFVVRGKENFRRLRNVIAKTDFTKVILTEEFFEQTIEKIKEVLIKEKNKMEVLYSKIKKALEDKDEKAFVDIDNMRGRDIIKNIKNRIKKYKLVGKELENAEMTIEDIDKSIKDRTKKGKLTDLEKGLLVKIKDQYENKDIKRLNDGIEKINKIKFEDVKNLHKKLKINKNIKKFNGYVVKKEKN